MALNIRYLRKANVSPSDAGSGVGVSQVIAFSLHMIPASSGVPWRRSASLLGGVCCCVARRWSWRVRAHPAHRGRVPAVRANSTIGRWRQRAVSSWDVAVRGVLLSTARLVPVSAAKQTAGSEQWQDTDVTAALLATGWGRLFLVLAGVVAVAAGVEVGRRSVRLDFRERFTAALMSRALATLIRVLGALGCAARAVVFVLAGFFIVKAAVLSSSGQAKRLDAVFRSVAGSAYGTWLLGVLASGLVCYGLCCLLEARYRDLTPGR